MLRRIALRDFVIVTALDLELHGGFTVLTGETGAGKSILVDALQLALGHRGDAGMVREGTARADITAEFDLPAALRPWLVDAGFLPDDDAAPPPADEPLLLRRTLDAQGKSRAWINGSPATVGQLREAGEQLVDIHGQHAWQSLTRPEAVRALLDGYARIDTGALSAAYAAWRAADDKLAAASGQQATLARERDRLAWQIQELGTLAPAAGEWPELNAEHQRLGHAQAILDAVQTAITALSGSDGGNGAGNDGDASADSRCGQAIDALDGVVAHDPSLREPLDVLRSAQAQLQDAAHTLHAALARGEPEPDRLQQLDERLAAWMGLARRLRQPPDQLPAVLAGWRAELAELDASADLAALHQAVVAARKAFDAAAASVTAQRRLAAPRLATAITEAMQGLGMAGGRFEVGLQPLAAPQRHGLESAEFLVAGHAGSTARPLAKVASGGELSRIALAIAVTTSELGSAGSLIFDEIDAGIGGTVADAVGRLMRALGRDRQVLAVTHLPQVAAAAHAQCVVSKRRQADGTTASDVQPVTGADRAQEIARMLGGAAEGTSLAHAQALLAAAAQLDDGAPPAPTADAPAADGKAPTPARTPTAARKRQRA